MGNCIKFHKRTPEIIGRCYYNDKCYIDENNYWHGWDYVEKGNVVNKKKLTSQEKNFLGKSNINKY